MTSTSTKIFAISMSLEIPECPKAMTMSTPFDLSNLASLAMASASSKKESFSVDLKDKFYNNMII